MWQNVTNLIMFTIWRIFFVFQSNKKDVSDTKDSYHKQLQYNCYCIMNIGRGKREMGRVLVGVANLPSS